MFVDRSPGFLSAGVNGVRDLLLLPEGQLGRPLSEGGR